MSRLIILFRYFVTFAITISMIGCGPSQPEAPSALLTEQAKTQAGNTSPASSPNPTFTPKPTPTIVPYALQNVIHRELGWKTKIVRTPDSPPQFVNISPEDEVLMIVHHDDSIYKINTDGSLSVYAQFPGVKLECFHFDPSNQLWFSTNRDGTFRVDKDGNPIRIAPAGTNREFVFDSQGNLYAVDYPSNNIQKITPSGKVSVLVDNFTTAVIAINAKDEIFSTDMYGRLVQVMPDGNLKTITENLGIESWIGFAPDNTLYHLNWSGLSTIDVNTGSVTKVDWYDRYSNSGNRLVFDSKGNFYTFHPNHPIYRVSPINQTSEMIYRSKGNTTAMAIAPDGRIYVAYGDQLPSGESVVYQINSDESLQEIVKVPYGLALSLAFANSGTGYLGVADRDKGEMILTFDPITGIVSDLTKPKCYPYSIDVDPITDYLWWFSCNQVHFMNESEIISDLPIPENTRAKYLFFGPDGKLYAILWFPEPGQGQPAPHGVYTRMEDGNWTEIANLTNEDPYVTWAMGTVCPDNSLYVITHMDVKKMLISNIKGTLNGVLRLEIDGNLDFIAGGFSVDAFAIHCEKQTGDLVFTAIDAIYRLYKIK